MRRSAARFFVNGSEKGKRAKPALRVGERVRPCGVSFTIHNPPKGDFTLYTFPYSLPAPPAMNTRILEFGRRKAGSVLPAPLSGSNQPDRGRVLIRLLPRSYA